MKEFYARKTENERRQTLRAHLNGVAELCEKYCSKFTDRKVGRFIGEVHDIGKYSQEFQDRLDNNAIRVDHATAGALECIKLLNESEGNPKNFFYKFMASAICGHHSGLQDYGVENSSYSTVARRCKEYSVQYKENYLSENNNEFDKITAASILPHFKRNGDELKVSLYNYNRFLYSALIDADRLDAEKFSEQYKADIRKRKIGFEDLGKMFNEYMEGLFKKAESSQKPINKIRKDIYSECLIASEGQKGIYTLNVPTGGGKTLSSMAFSLNHIHKHKMDRIIYSIPFTSIIEQNSAEFAKIFGSENILEHHSQYYNPFGDSDPRAMKLELAAENWDMPIVVTTNVQFFESFFSKEAKRCRKLHNIANSVIILDEVQSMPFNYIKPCIEIIGDLVKSYGCTVVFCSATQMDFEKQSEKHNLLPKDIEINHIISRPKDLQSKLKRVDFKFIEKKDILEVSELIMQHSQALIVVNTKRHAMEIFEKIKDKQNTFYLTTNIYPAQRKKIIAKIKELLKDEKPVIVVSTQLIEAGVDVDFPVVFRSISGIDSIIQAGGRCNREGKRENANCYVFQPEEEFVGKGYLNNTATVSRTVIEKFGDEFTSNQAIQQYYTELIGLDPKRIDEKEIMKLILEGAGNLEFPFEEISKRFRIIEDTGYPLIIRTEESLSLLNKIRFGVGYRDSIRKLSQYTVNVSIYLFEKLKESRAIQLENDMFYVLTRDDLYREDIGLYLDDENMNEMELYIF